jgi:hypothetical protein
MIDEQPKRGRPKESRSARFEEFFAGAQRDLGAAAKAAAKLKKQLDDAAKAAATGDVRQLEKALEAVRALSGEIAASFATIDAGAVTSELRAALEDGRFAAEVERAAEGNLRGVRVSQGYVLSFPVVATFAPADLSVTVGKKKLKTLRPSAVVAALAKARESVPKANPKLLDIVEKAYRRVTGGEYRIAARIDLVHAELTPLPGQAAAYPVMEFVGDLYLLERSKQLRAASGKVLNFAASTSAKGDKAFRIATEDGQERIYSSIRFD